MFIFEGLKQINGWYNIYDFNRWTVGQIKIGIFPSVVLSPSRSAKYFKHHEFVEPVNLEHVFFSNKFEGQHEYKQQLTVDDNTSRSMLFEKLKLHLNDLSDMTNKMKISNQETVPVRDTTVKDLTNALKNSPELDQVAVCRDESTKNSEKVEEILESVTGENILPIDNSNNTHTSTMSEKNNPLIQYGIVSNDVFNINDTIQKVQNIDTEQQCEEIQENHVDGFLKSDEDLMSLSCCPEDELNDSTDELLEHLRDFEKKYKHLKEIVQNDSDFDDSEDENKCKDNSMRKDRKDSENSSFQSPRDVESLNDGGEERKEAFTFDCDVVNVSSGDPTKEDIQLSSRSHLANSEKDYDVDDNFEDQIVAHCKEPFRSEQPVSFEMYLFRAGHD